MYGKFVPGSAVTFKTSSGGPREPCAEPLNAQEPCAEPQKRSYTHSLTHSLRQP